MHIHLIGVCGTGMGSLAGLLGELGHRVTGSDTAFYPPMGDALVRWGVETHTAYDPNHLVPTPDLVVVGNVCRSDNPEARAALDGGMRVTSMPAALEELILHDRTSHVIAGTHGKTTSSALSAFLLKACGIRPGFLIGGIPQDFDRSFAVGDPQSPFVIEGDEYDSAFFEKRPKFWRYRPHHVLLTSIEHDHIDIYPDEDSYRTAFDGFVERIDPGGVLVAYAGDAAVRQAAAKATCRVVYYALDGEPVGDVLPTWLAAPAAATDSVQPFDLFVGGSSCGRVLSPLAGRHNARNAVGSMALIAEAYGIGISKLAGALAGFSGIRRRQELVGVARGVRVYDDFAHHPTAVAATLEAFRSRHGEGRVIAVFEPRSATASRRLHQEQYPAAFRAADVTLIAPVGRQEIRENERLDVAAIVTAIQARGGAAEAMDNIDAIVRRITELAVPGDTVAIMSNGAFGGIHARVLAALTAAV